MTERKPPGVSFESWADRQIREAEERGDFADLPGRGKPLPGLDTPYDEMWWLRAKAEREQLSYLPPALQLRKDAEQARTDALAARTEQAAREIVREVNERIRAAHRNPPEGPPLNVGPFDEERIAAAWRERRGLPERGTGGE